MTDAQDIRPNDITADVAIAGGGLAGLTMAIALGQAGLRVAVADREDPAIAAGAGFDGRNSAIALACWRMMQAIGLARHVEGAQPMWDIRVSDGDSLLFVHYDHRDIGTDPFGYLIENRNIRRAQQAALRDLPNVALMAPCAVTAADCGRPGDGRMAQLRLADGRLIHAPLIIAADGRSSPLREAAGIRLLSWGYDQLGIVCTVVHDEPHHGVAQERFLPGGPFAILPLVDDEAGRHRSSLVWTERVAVGQALMALPDDAFAAEMRLRFGTHLGTTTIVGPRWSYPLTFQHAERYIGHRLALIADAAHGIHPIAGQGLNLGLRDIAALAEVLIDAKRLGLDLGSETVLERYQRWRRPDNLMLSAVTDGLTRLFSTNLAPIRIARDLGLGLVNEIAPLKRIFMRHAMGDIGELPRLLRGQTV